MLRGLNAVLRAAGVVLLVLLLLLALIVARGSQQISGGGKVKPRARQNTMQAFLPDGFAERGWVGRISPNLAITAPGTFNWYGPCDGGYIRPLREWEAGHLSQSIRKHVKKVVSEAGGEAMWLTVRATHPSSAFDTPRWHKDGRFFEGEARKHVVTLLGPGTLFLRPGPEAALALAGVRDFEGNRRRLAEALASEPVVRTPAGLIVEFAAGERGAVHSEPPLSAPRIFVSVLAGSEAQIREMAASRGVAYE